ncbi:MAG: sugar ABC transporter permease [Chloroflexota bacterium]
MSGVAAPKARRSWRPGRAAPAGRSAGRPPGSRSRLRTAAWLVFFLAVPLTLLILLTYVPVVNMVLYSFQRWDGLSQKRDFIGLDNYVRFFTRPDLYGVLFVSVYYLVGAVVQIALALFLATAMTFKLRFKNLFKGMIFFPYLLNGVAVAFIFLYCFQPGGVLDSLLGAAGVQEPPKWLGDRGLVNWSLTGVSVWRFLGLNFVLFLGAMQSIPADMFEASELDGAGRWQQFRYLIVPSIKPVIALSAILAISGSLAVFEIPYIMLQGANGTTTFVIQTIDTAFQYHKFGLASAMAVVLLGLILVITFIQRRVVPEDDGELA